MEAHSIHLRLILRYAAEGAAIEKEAFAVHQSALKFDLYLRGEKYVLCCNQKSLEPFLSKDIKIPKLNSWSIELADYNITFVYMKGKDNALADTISRLKTLNIYKEPLGNIKAPVVSDT